MSAVVKAPAPVYRRGMWLANGKRAYQVLRTSGDHVVLLGDCGCEFKSTLAKLEAYGYRPVKSKPRYAGSRL